uniref:Uncharacterized protein n=1 Tax=Bionectria ochroleuca TaxID=29856 RepID=A0A0B7JTW7_BIOOC
MLIREHRSRSEIALQGEMSVKLEPITNHDTRVHTPLNKAGLQVRVILDPSSKSRTANRP